MQSQSQSQIIRLVPDTPWRAALALLVARGWTPRDLLLGIDALDAVRDVCATSTPHQVALCLYRRARDAGLLEGGLGTSPWALRVGILLNADVEMRALMTVAEAFRRGETLSLDDARPRARIG